MKEKIVFTNGCFDIIHPGHIDLLERARQLGTKLIVGINSDSSVRAIKGLPRPFMSQADRACILKSLRFVDEVYVFDEPTPEKLIRQIKPDVLVKGGDWKKNEIVGADFVENRGGEVFSVSLKEGYSSSIIVEKIRAEHKTQKVETISEDNFNVEKTLKRHIELFQSILDTEVDLIKKCAGMILEAFQNGGKILICGNGKSAAVAQYIAAELTGLFESGREALPVIALTTDTSATKALAGDFGIEKVFSRQVEAIGLKGDLLVALSTGGNSPNVNAAVMSARQIGCQTIGITGSEGKKLASLCDACIFVPEKRNTLIQDAQIKIGHIWCEIIEDNYMQLCQ